MLDVKLETIDEVKALEYLTHSDGNRPYRQSYTSQLASKQERGEWQTNGDSIRFDSDGILRDGQHRLKMVTQTGIPIEVVVIRGIDPNSFITMDIGRKRNLADVLSIKGEANPQTLAGALSWIRRYLTGNMLFYGATHEQHFTILSQHPDIRDSVAFYSDLSKPAGYPGQHSIAVACHYLFSRVDPVKAGELIKGYVIGLGLGDTTDPVYRLREQVIGYRTSKLKPTPQQMFGLFCFSWNSFRNGRPQSQRFKLATHQRGRIRIDGFPKKLFTEEQLPLEEDNGENEA